MSFENDSKKKQEYYKGKKQYISLYKRARGCKFCGYNKCVSALDFHHIGEGKEVSISNCSSLEKIKKEITKCVVLCKNCHAELHESREGGTMVGYERIDTKKLGKILQILSGQDRLNRIKKEATI
ncbi:hypothetical protein ES705_43437 [subsurface metagenome]